MLYVYPDYYKDFKCIAGECRHSCCIGWEIDVDAETREYYSTVGGKIGEKLKKCISDDGQPHFILTDDDRCPFLNADNLCELILTIGEEHLCGICADHPRFKCELPGRVEVGIGLCCEAAARLILSRKSPMALEYSEKAECDDEIILLRDKVIALLQNREKNLFDRFDDMLMICRAVLPDISVTEFASELLSLERLDDAWTGELERVIDFANGLDIGPFAEFMKEREHEYEQFAVYLIYRYFASAYDLQEAAVRAAFAVLSTKLIYCLGALKWRRGTDSFSLEDQIELVRLFSSEIEYSEENLEAVFDLLTQY